jgi:hypothetical protein
MLLRASRAAGVLTKAANFVLGAGRGAARLAGDTIKGVTHTPIGTHTNMLMGGLTAGAVGGAAATAIGKSEQGLSPAYAKLTQYPGVPTLPR